MTKKLLPTYATYSNIGVISGKASVTTAWEAFEKQRAASRAWFSSSVISSFQTRLLWAVYIFLYLIAMLKNKGY